MSPETREALRQALADDVSRYHQDTLIVRHQALCEAIARVINDTAGENVRALRLLR